MKTHYDISSIKIQPEPTQTHLTSFTTTYGMNETEQQQIEEDNQTIRAANDSVSSYLITDLKNTYVCKDYLEYRFDLIIKTSKYIQELFNILININEVKEKLLQIDNEPREYSEIDIFLFQKVIKKTHLVVDLLEKNIYKSL